METVSIRNLRGKTLREKAHSGKPLAITNHRALVGVLIPVAAAWVEQLIDYNWSQVRQSIAEGETALKEGPPLTRLQDTIAAIAVTGEPAPGKDSPPAIPEKLAVPLVAALTGETLAQTPEGREAIQQLRSALAPPPQADNGKKDRQPSVRTVRIGDLSASLIEKAGEDGQTLAITHDRELIGIVIPVTRGLVEFLIEQNVSRVLYNIIHGEAQLRAAGELTTLDEALDPPEPSPPPGRKRRPQSSSPEAASEGCATAQP